MIHPLFSKKTFFAVVSAILSFTSPATANAGQIVDSSRLQRDLQQLADRHPGRVGICVQDETVRPISVNGDRPFSLQSVMKVIVGAAAMRAVDDGKLKLDDVIVIRREDLSVNVQPIADIVAAKGSFRTTVEDLIARAVIESDSAATDVLIEKLGGARAVQSFLTNAGIIGIRIDRTERELQTETVGLKWQDDYVSPDRLDAARKRVSDADKATAFAAYLKDPRDTATPEAMTAFLAALSSGKLLSTESTHHFLSVMAKTKTFPNRLRAGIPAGWSIGHKTGTSQTHHGVNGVSNDVGILTAPDGTRIAIAVFVAESTAPEAARAEVIANAARLTTAAYR